MTLMDICEREYFPLNHRIRDEQSRRQYRYALANLAEFLGRAPTVGDLVDDNVCRLMTWLRDVKKLHPRTINDRRGRIHALWTWLARRGVVDKWPTTPALSVPQRAPRAWTEAELHRLMSTASTLPGTLCELPESIWWVTALAILWDTGMRASELLSLEWSMVDLASGWVTVPAEVRKGKLRDACYCLMPDTRSWLAKLPHRGPLVLNWTMCRGSYFLHWSRLLKAAGLSCDRYSKTQRIRRSVASWIAVGGGDATAALGHADRATTLKHYLDPRLTQARYAERLPFRLLSPEEAK